VLWAKRRAVKIAGMTISMIRFHVKIVAMRLKVNGKKYQQKDVIIAIGILIVNAPNANTARNVTHVIWSTLIGKPRANTSQTQ
jgi:hypothetical protein